MPARSMARIGTWCVPKTMAFGGVATGSMKAQEADSVAGSSTSIRSIRPLIAAAARMGSITCVMAVLLVISVRKVMTRATPSIINGRGRPARKSRCSPSQADAPEVCMPQASAKPPPSSSTMSHGSRRKASPSSTGRPSCPRSRNSQKAPNMATVPSSTPGCGSSAAQPGMSTPPACRPLRLIQANAVSASTQATMRSSRRMPPSCSRA